MTIKVTRPKPTGVPGIVQDGPGRFLVRARWRDTTGRRRKREGVAATLAEAVALKESLAREEAPKERPTRQRFSAFAEQWIEEHGGRAAPSTRTFWATALAHATVAFGDVFVDALAPAEFRAWRNRAAKRVSPATFNGWLRTVRVCLDDAVEDGILQMNPARAVKTLREGRTAGARGTSLSVDEFRRFVSATKLVAAERVAEDVARLVLLLAWTGVRIGEARALRWDDLVDGELHVERSVWNRYEKATKTDDPRRVTVVGPLAEVLAEQRRWLLERQHAGLSSGLMFPASPVQARGGASRRGDDEVTWYRSASVVAEPLRRIAAVAEVPRITAHSLRRTWENLLRRAGVDQLVRRSLAGWRTEEAQAIYATVDPAERKAAGAAVVRLVMGTAT